MAEVVDTVERLLDEAIRLGERNADQMVQYACQLTAVRRRVRAALVVLEQGRPEAARRLLEEALAADGEFIKRRFDKVLTDWREKHGLTS